MFRKQTLSELAESYDRAARKWWLMLLTAMVIAAVIEYTLTWGPPVGSFLLKVLILGSIVNGIMYSVFYVWFRPAIRLRKIQRGIKRAEDLLEEGKRFAPELQELVESAVWDYEYHWNSFTSKREKMCSIIRGMEHRIPGLLECRAHESNMIAALNMLMRDLGALDSTRRWSIIHLDNMTLIARRR